MIQTKIISGFPGIGKSYFYNKNKDISLDSDSSCFHWNIINGKKETNKCFPNNYIKNIKENIGRYEYIFVSSHKIVRDALKQNCLFYYLVYPNMNMKDVFIKRYTERGNDEKFIERVNENWNQWINECQNVIIGCKNIEMQFDNLSHIIDYNIEK